MKFYIVSSYHDEPAEVYNNLFESINNQIDFNFEDIRIIMGRSDGENIFPDITPFTNISSHITFITQKCWECTPGSSKQLCLDYIKTVYPEEMQDNNPVIFCDADDWLSSEVALRDVCNTIFINGYFDVIHFAMQVWENYDFKVDYNEWLTHAHVYNLSSIYRWDVQFTYNLRMFDDLLFNYCILSTPDLIKYNYYDVHIYCWNNRNNSTSKWQISRSNNDVVIDLCNFWHELKRWQEQHNLGISFLEWFVWPINCLNEYLDKPSELDEYVFEYGQSTLRAFNQYITNNHLDVTQFI